MTHNWGKSSHDHHATIDSTDTRANATVELESYDIRFITEIREMTGELDVNPEEVVTFAFGKTVERLRDNGSTDGDESTTRTDGGTSTASLYGRSVASSTVDDLSRWNGWDRNE